MKSNIDIFSDIHIYIYYQAKEITKKGYNNIMNSIKL